MPSRETDERGQILSSYAALAAVMAVVAGLVVLITTRGDESAAGPRPPLQSTTRPVGQVTSPPRSPAVVNPTPTPVVSPTSVAPSTVPSSPTPAPPTPTATPIPASELPAVEVYNNTRRRGLADQVGDKARAVGWTVAGADNWRGKIVASTVYYPAGMQAAAVQLAEVLGISRTKEALPNMKKDRLSVILTSDYAG